MYINALKVDLRSHSADLITGEVLLDAQTVVALRQRRRPHATPLGASEEMQKRHEVRRDGMCKRRVRL